MSDIQETWASYNDKYEVSDLGNVRSKVGQKYRSVSYNPRNGFATVNLNRGPDDNYNCTLHRMVAEAFNLPKPDGYDCLRHKDGNKSNNALSNLEWIPLSQIPRRPCPPRPTNTGHNHICLHSRTVQTKKKGEKQYNYYEFRYKGHYKIYKTLEDAIRGRDAHMAALNPPTALQN